MSEHTLTVVQLYEDIPNTTFTSGRLRGDVVMSSQPVIIVENPIVATPRRKKVGKGGDTAISSVSLHVSGSRDSRESTAPREPKSRRSFKGKKSVLTPRKSTSATTRSDKKMTSATAVELYGDKLTALEKTEIMEYPSVYYFGDDAKKIFNLELGSKENYGFDDTDHFYRVIAHDHVAFRYEIAEKPLLGKGTFGMTIRAYDHKLMKWVALKMIRNEKIYLAQSKEELKILQVLKKQDTSGIYNVVKLYDSFMFRNHMVFSFELLGMNLYQLLKRQHFRGLATPRILHIGRGVLKCLELLYKNKIIHCDIKPENIMLVKNSDLTSVKVGDFGSSCYEQQQKYHYIQSRYYRAPEVMLGLRYGPPIDMWSLGCVLAELAVGRPILVGDDEDDQLAAVKEAIGDIPETLLNRCKNRNKGDLSVNGRGKAGSKPLANRLEGDDLFKDTIKKILVWDPEHRPTPLEIQKHPWISSSHSGSIKSSTTTMRKASAGSNKGKKSTKPTTATTSQEESSLYRAK